MNYQKIYNDLINRATHRKIVSYKETHHIIPRCMGGSNNPENLVDLTPEEHYVAHQLLVKIYPHNFLLKNAAAMMVVNRPSNKLYGWIRRELGKSQSIRQSGVNNSQFGTRWVTDGNIEKKVNEDFVILEPWVNGRLSGVLNNRLKKEREREKIEKQKNKLAAKIEHLRFLHNMYVNEGFDGVKQLGYKHTQVNLVNLFSKYLPEFVPQNGRKRKVQQAPQ